MRRYGLVYLWHREQLQNQNRSITKQKRVQPQNTSASQRNRLQTHCQPQLRQRSNTTTSVSQDENQVVLPNHQIQETCQITKAKEDLKQAKKRVEQAEVDCAETNIKIKRLEHTQARTVATNFRSAYIYSRMLENAREERRLRENERSLALEELREKEHQLSKLQPRKCSM